MAEISPSQLQGLLIPGPFCTPANLWTAQSSYSQASPSPGVPTTTENSTAVLQATGEMAASTTLQLQCLKGGLSGASGWVWKYTAENWRGWDVPGVITWWDALVWADGSGGGVLYAWEPHTLALSDGSFLTAWRDEISAVSNQYRVRVNRRTRTGTDSTVTVYSTSTAPTDGFHPCMCLLPSGRVLLFHYIYDGTTVQVRMWYSDDNAASWTLGSGYCLNTALRVDADWEVRRMAAAYKSGEVLLVCGIYNDTSNEAQLVQYASSDNGAQFKYIDQSSGSGEVGTCPTIITYNNSFYVFYVAGSGFDPSYRKTGSAYNSIFNDSASSTFGSGGVLQFARTVTTQADEANLAVVLDENGHMYVYGIAYDLGVNKPGVLNRSTDGGITWERVGQSSLSSTASLWHYQADASTYPNQIHACLIEGRVVLAHNWSANPGNEDNSIGIMGLGGYSTVTMPGYTLFPVDTDRVSWETTWLPFDEPADAGVWGATGAGTDTLASGRLEVSTSASQRFYSRTFPGTVAEGYICRFAARQISGGSLLSDAVAVGIRLADGTNEYSVSLRIYSTGIALVDNNAGTTLATTTITTTADFEVLVAMASAKIRVWTRVRSWGADREWTLALSSDSLTNDTATPAATNLAAWGHIASATASSYWYEFHDTSDEWTGKHLASGQTSPDELFPRVLGADPVGIDGGTRVAHTGGSAFQGDDFTVVTRYSYPLTNAFPDPYPSPRIHWRSTSTSQADIALAFDPDLTTIESNLETDVLGLYLGGINWRTGSLWGYDQNTTAWVKLADIDTGLTGLTYTRNGITIRPNGVTTTFLFDSEFSGCTVDLGTSTLRKIASHSGGLWTTDSNQRKPVVTLASPDGTEPASGTAVIWAKQMAVLVSLRGATYTAYRLRIDSQSTVEGYHQIGALVLGPVYVFGNSPAQGWVRGVQAGAQITETPDRISRSRVQAPPRRTVQIAWTEPIIQERVYGSSPAPNYLRLESGGQPVANRGSTLRDIEGLVNRLDGPNTPVVYLPRIPTGSQTVTINRPDSLLYGRALEGAIERTNVWGSEGTDEVDRGPTITIREEV